MVRFDNNNDCRRYNWFVRQNERNDERQQKVASFFWAAGKGQAVQMLWECIKKIKNWKRDESKERARESDVKEQLCNGKRIDGPANAHIYKIKTPIKSWTRT